MTHTQAATTVAQTILDQLGGQRFVGMTGAKHLLSIEKGRGLQFKLPSNFAKDSINTVRIILRWDDLYDVEYGYARGVVYRVISKSESLYFDDLQRNFSDATGLDTTL